MVEPAMSGGGGSHLARLAEWDGGDPDIVGRMWTGSQWTTEEVLAGTDSPERYPDVAWNGSGYGLVYHRKTESGWAIGFRDAPDSGSFGPEILISTPSLEGRYPCIAGIPGGFAVAWQGSGGEILFSMKQANDWTAPEVVSGADHGVRPSVAHTGSGDIVVSWTAGMSSIRYATLSEGVWSSGETAATADAIDDGRMAAGSDGRIWLVYGARGDDLQWDLRAATPDPSGVNNGETGHSGLSVANTGGNPVGPAAVISVVTDYQTTELTIHDMAGRIIHSQACDLRGVHLGLFPGAPGHVHGKGYRRRQHSGVQAGSR